MNSIVELTISHLICSGEEGRWHHSFVVFQIHHIWDNIYMICLVHMVGWKVPVKGAFCLLWKHSVLMYWTLVPHSSCITEQQKHGYYRGEWDVPEEFIVEEVVREEELQKRRLWWDQSMSIDKNLCASHGCQGLKHTWATRLARATK